MVSLTVERLVDLYTPSLTVKELVLTEFPEKLFPDTQMHADTSDPNYTEWCFARLQQRAAVDFMDSVEGRLAGHDEYSIRDYQTGNFVQIRANGRVYRTQQEIDELMRRTQEKFQ